MRKDIRKIIFANLRRGFTLPEIKQQLLQKGFFDYDIDEEIRNLNTPVKEEYKKKKPFLRIRWGSFFKIFFVLVIFIGIILLFAKVEPIREIPKVTNVPNANLTQGVLISLIKNNIVNFEFDGKNYSIFFSSSDKKKVLLENQELAFTKKNNTHELNMNSSSNKLYIQLNYTRSSKNIYLRELVFVPCVPIWDCGDWGLCLSGMKTRTCLDVNNCGTNENKPQTIIDCETIPPVDPTTEPLVPEPFIPENKSFIDCGTENSKLTNDCFIVASIDCSFAKMTGVLITDYFGVLITSTTDLELHGEENGKCKYYEKSVETTIQYSQELIDELLASGYTEEEIALEEEMMNEEAQSIVGSWVECLFEKQDLTSILGRWNSGVMDGGASCSLQGTEMVCEYTGDFANAECISGM